MPMFPSLNDLRRADGGNSVLEFAFLLPVLLLLLVGTTEIGRAYYQAAAVEKGLRSAALFAARSPMPLAPETQAMVENLARTGTLDGSGPLLVAGWASPAARLTVTTRTFSAAGVTTPVIDIDAEVPFSPMMPGLYGFMDMGNHTIRMNHEQAYLGL